MESLSKATTAFKFDKPLAIITEGLISYLSRGEIGVLADNIHEILEKFGGLWIAQEVHTKDTGKKYLN